MKIKRKSISQETLALESAMITQFVLTHVKADPTVKALPIQELYDDYCDYLARKGLDSELSLDGFGRLFPKNFERRAVHVKGRALKCVLGVRVQR